MPVESIELSFDGASAVVHGELPHDAFDANTNPFTAHAPDDDEDASDGEDDELDEDKVLPVANEHGEISHFPGEDEHPHHHKGAKKEAARSVIAAGVESIKYLYSCGLLVFSIIVVMAAIFNKQTQATGQKGLPPIVAFLIFWFLIVWLAYMEGGQGCLVGLQPIDKALYAESHPRTLKCTVLAHKGDNMERFIIGRQFLVVLTVFVINLMSTTIPDAKVLGLSPLLFNIFLGSGISAILITIMMGQLTGQVNAANCMLDYVNNYFMLFTTYVSLAIECSGLLHAVYLVQIFFSKITGKPIESNEPPRNALRNVIFWGRVVLSCVILIFAFAVTLKALFENKTTMWSGIPPYVSVIIFFLLMGFAGMFEGMQIALFAVVNLPEEDLVHHTIAHKNCQIVFSGQNLQAFLIGRQISVTACMFVVARITTLNYKATDPTVFGVSEGLQNFFNTGLLGAVITTIVASLAFRIIASSFPIAFLSNPLVYLIIRLCLFMEKTGVCSAAWVLARYHKPLIGYQPDTVYLEGDEKHGHEPVTRRDKDIDRLVTILKFMYSIALLGFSVVMLLAGIFGRKTTGVVPPIASFLIICFLIPWLGMMEGGQGALVGLQPIDKTRYAESHPRTLMCTSLAHRGDNMERFIIGRQFLVVLTVFVINLVATFPTSATVLGLPHGLNEFFLNTGIAATLITIMLGQLTAQVNAANCMLDFLNNYFMLFTTYVSLAIEFSGLLHSVYLVQIAFSKITGKPIESKLPPRNLWQNIFFWGRVTMSVVILIFSFVVTLKALFNGKTTMWSGIPPYVSVIIFFILMCFVGMMEGMQIALFAVVNLPESEIQHHAIAYANCQLTFAGQNLQAFLIGRQICVTICMFVVARISTLNYATTDPPVFGVSHGLQHFFNTGLLGAVITTIVASLAFRIIASSFPIAFLSNPLVYLIIRLCLTLEASGLCSAAWVTGRFNKLLVSFQPDKVYLEGAEPHTNAPVTRRDKDIDITITVIKYLYSLALLVFCVTLAMTAIFTKQTNVAKNVSPVLAIFLFWGLLVWLGMMEGGQGCLVGLQPVEKDLYMESHPITYKCTSLAHYGDNMERFILGRQFLVVLVVFVLNLCTTTIANAKIFHLSHDVYEVFFASSIATIFCTVTMGQLTAQVNAANCMLDFINTRFMLFTTWVSLAIEFSGLVHSVYLVQIFFSKITGKPIESKLPPRNLAQNLFFWGRVLMSVAILIFALIVTLTALFENATTMWAGVPAYVSVILFFVLMCFVGMMEGMQIALFAVVKLPADALDHAPIAKKNCELTFHGRNLQAFLIGRQICVTLCMFIVANVATVKLNKGQGNILGASNGMEHILFNTGLLGAVITTIVGSLSWRIIAASFPIAFLSNPLVFLIIRLCLFLEASGLCSVAWLLALIHKQLIGFQLDEVYIGTAEERAAAKKTVENDELGFEEEGEVETEA